MSMRRSPGGTPCLALVLFVAGGCATTTTHDSSFQRRFGEYTYCELEERRQVNAMDCGPACVLTVMQYWKVDPLQSVDAEEYFPPSATGYTLSQLKEAALNEGLKAYIIAMREGPRAQIEEQVRKGRPVICAVRRPASIGPARYIPLLGWATQAGVTRFGPKTNHFVVVMGLSDRRVLLMDPAMGFDSVSWRTFMRRWSEMNYATLLLSA